MSELVYYRDLDEQLLVFPILGTKAGIELKYVKSISLVSELIPIPRSPKYIMGIVNIDSNIYPVIDLDILLSGKSNLTTRQPIISLIDIKSTTFGIHTHNLPQVVPGTAEDATNEADVIPSKWIVGYTEHPELGSIPIIDPKKFWVGMGDNEVVGPLLDTEMTASEMYAGQSFEDDIEEEQHQDAQERNVVVPEEENLEQTKEVEELEDEAELNELSLIDGVGPKVLEDLMSAGYNSVDALNNASMDDLMDINGIGKKTAENIKSRVEEYLKGKEDKD